MNYVECPYCGTGQDVCHDDGFGYEEDVLHEMECSECDKNFVFNTSILYLYEAKKAGCLNGSQHEYEPTKTYPKRYTMMRCRQCDFRRKPTDEEMAEVMNETR